MPLEARDLLRRAMDRAFEREASHPPLAEAVRGLTAAQAAWKPSPARHSIWQIVRHVTHWKVAALAALDGRPVDYDRWNRDDWAEAEGDQAAWDRDVARLREVSAALRSRVESLDDAALETPIRWYAQTGRPRPPAFALLDLAAHDAYHAGQIQYLFALQEVPVEELAAAASRDDLDRMRRLLDAHPAAAASFSRDGWTALHVAAYFGMVEAVRELLRRGAPAGAVSRNAEARTPLHLAAAGIANRAEIARLLLRAGADPRARDARGRRPLDVAREHGRSDVAAVLEAG